MARDHARIYVSIWADEAFRALPIRAQHMWFTLLSQDRLTYCGVLDWLPVRIANLAEDASIRNVTAAVTTLERAGFVVTDAETGELLIRSFVRHDGLLSQPNVTKSMANHYEAVLSPTIKAAIERELARAYTDQPDLSGWKALEKGYPNLYAKATAKGSGKGSANG